MALLHVTHLPPGTRELQEWGGGHALLLQKGKNASDTQDAS